MAVHRIAARLDGRYELVAGALASTPEKAKASGEELGLDPARCYGDFAEMAKREARRKDGIDAVAIVTPNHVHFPAAKAFLDRGIHVICDKPMTTTLKDARKLAELVEKSGCAFVLTHNYTGYPDDPAGAANGGRGPARAIRLVQAEYVQDWLTTKLEDTGQKQAGWRTDPARSGPAGSTGDIGTHAMNLASFVTGLAPESLSADLRPSSRAAPWTTTRMSCCASRAGPRACSWASQVAPGNENALRLRVYGDKAGLAGRRRTPTISTSLHSASRPSLSVGAVPAPMPWLGG